MESSPGGPLAECWSSALEPYARKEIYGEASPEGRYSQKYSRKEGLPGRVDMICTIVKGATGNTRVKCRMHFCWERLWGRARGIILTNSAVMCLEK